MQDGILNKPLKLAALANFTNVKTVTTVTDTNAAAGDETFYRMVVRNHETISVIFYAQRLRDRRVRARGLHSVLRFVIATAGLRLRG